MFTKSRPRDSLRGVLTWSSPPRIFPDTSIRDDNPASQYDWTHWAQDGGTFMLALAAMAIANHRFQLAFAALNLAVEHWFIAANFTTLG